MSTPAPDPWRLSRRRREHERQIVVFGLLGLLLAGVAAAALLVFTGAIRSPLERPFSTSDDGLPHRDPPCLPEVYGQPQGALPIPYDQIHVNVRNASGQIGVAGAGQEVLATRGFRVDSIGNWDRIIPSNELRFGREGIVAAYTLAAQFEEIRLILDNRADPSVHLVIGENFASLVPPEKVQIAADTPLINFPGCRPAAGLRPDPAPTDYEPPAPPETPEEDPVEGENAEGE